MQPARYLSAEEFHACFAGPMRNVTAEAEAVVDIWPYINSLDLDALNVPSINDVHYVYRDAADRFDQILIGTGRFNTMLAVVVDRRLTTVFGHHLLDLNKLYDRRGGHLNPF
jgi:hypothetical protein